jgi:hypothetical protein
MSLYDLVGLALLAAVLARIVYTMPKRTSTP